MRKKNIVDYIIGNRGVGKTTYINYLLSTKMEEFNKRNVVPVRVTLLDGNAINYDLRELVLIKAFRIILECYIVPNKTSDISKYNRSQYSYDEFIEFLRNYNDEDYNDFIMHVIRNYQSKLDLYEDTEHKEQKRLGFLLCQFMIHMKHSLLFILDGFDEATLPLMQEDILKKWNRSLNDIYNSRQTYPRGVYLIVSREDSLQSMRQHYSSEGVIGKNSLQWFVESSNLTEVLKNKIEIMYYKSKEIPQLSKWKKEYFEQWYKITQTTVNRCLDYLNMPLEYLNKLAKNGHMRDIIGFYSLAMWETASLIEEMYKGKSLSIAFEELLKGYSNDHDVFVEDIDKFMELSSIEY